jgi:enamine deaminase RidA (YjgF/YER057c/UK114 family)
VRVSGKLGRAPGAAGVEAGASLGAQWRQALENLLTVVRASGGDIGNIVMLRAYVTDMAEFNAGGAQVAEAWAATLGRHFPAMTLVAVSALVDPNARVEIEAEVVLA